VLLNELFASILNITQSISHPTILFVSTKTDLIAREQCISAERCSTEHGRWIQLQIRRNSRVSRSSRIAVARRMLPSAYEPAGAYSHCFYPPQAVPLIT